VRIGERAFVGATPELLLSRRGTQLRTEALAGTAACSPTAGASAASTAAGGRDPGEGDQAAAQLRASSKDRAEHAIVVEAIKRALRPVCEDIDSPPEPRIRRLSRMVHLWSPMTARQTRQEPLLSLVARLHPTPAVGGLPRAQALSFISAHEAAERGWYASPVGFIDADGDGDFVVALRSALIHADRVHLFAGAGIVAESDPNAEFDETELKLGAMQRALGIA
jgi:isochorismate synthase